MPDQTHGNLTIDRYFDRVFYINLREDKQRNLHMVEQFKNYAISNYERVDAVKLKSTPVFDDWRNFNRTDEKYVLGSLSCRASHLKAIKIAKERDYSRILILEDDVVFLKNPNELLNINDKILSDWDVLYFGGMMEPHFRNQVVGTYAYALKASVFSDILLMGAASGMEMDNFYAKVLQHMSYNKNQSGKYNIRVIEPFGSVKVKSEFGSSIR